MTPFVLTKPEARALVAGTTCLDRNVPEFGVLFQPNVEGRSRIVAASGHTMVIRFGAQREGEPFAVLPHVLATLHRATPPKAILELEQRDPGTGKFTIRERGGVLLSGTFGLDEKPRLLGHNIENYCAGEPQTRWERLTGDKPALGVQPKYLHLVEIVAAAVKPKHFWPMAEWYVEGPMEPIKFVFRNRAPDGDDKERWRVVIMPMRVR